MNQSDIILIYQLGKVGSSSVYSTLKDIYGDERLIQLHFLSEKFKERSRGLEKYKWHRQQINKVEQLRKASGEARIKIISLVREPVGRNISDLFQNPGNYLASGQTLATTDLDDLIRIYKEKNSYDYTLNWFEQEFLPYTGVDVYQHDFNQSAGYTVFSEREYDILIMKMESLNNCFQRAFFDLLGIQVEALVISNESDFKATSRISKQLKQRIHFSESELDSVYSSQYVQHFYGDSIAALKEKWIKRVH